MQLSRLLTGMALSMIIVFGFFLFLSDGILKYQPSTVPADYNDTFLRITNSFQNLTTDLNETQSKTSLVGSDESNPLSDFIGFFFGQGYKAAQVLVGGVELLNVFVDEFIDNTIGGTALGSVAKSVGFLLIVIAIVAMLLHFVIKSEWI